MISLTLKRAVIHRPASIAKIKACLHIPFTHAVNAYILIPKYKQSKPFQGSFCPTKVKTHCNALHFL